MPLRPHRCLERKPSTQSVLFANEFINLSHLSLMSGVSVSFLSYVFSGKRQPSINTAKKIARALNMEFAHFISALEKHVAIPPYIKPITPDVPVEKIN